MNLDCNLELLFQPIIIFLARYAIFLYITYVNSVHSEYRIERRIMQILIVEDNSLQRKILGRYFAGTEYQLFEASTAEIAFSLIAENMPELIIADIILPGLDGVEFIKRLKAIPAYAQIPVIFLSSVSDYDIVVQALNSGANDYITKPFNKEELLARIKLHISLKKSQDIIRKQNEELRQASLFNYNIIDNAGEGIAIYDKELRYKVWNRALVNLTGISSEDVVGKTAVEVFPFITETGIDKLLIQSMNNDERVVSPVHQFVVPANNKSGWVRSVFVPNYDSNGEINGVIAVVSDVTDLLQKENALQSQSKFLQSLFDNMNTPFCYGELGIGNEIKIIQYNREFKNIIKASNRFIPEYLTIAIALPCLTDQQLQDLMAVALSGESILFEFFSTQSNKFYSAKAYSPELNKIALLLDDISEQKRATAQILETEANFRKLFEAIPIPLFLLVMDTGEIQYANNNACKLFEIDSENYIGTPFFRFYRNIEESEIVKNRLSQSDSSYDFEFEMITRGGKHIWVQNTSRIIKYKGVDLLFTAIIDFTEHKRILTELSDSESKYRLIAENMNDVIWQVDKELRLLFISPNSKYSSSIDIDTNTLGLDEIFTNQDGVLRRHLLFARSEYEVEGKISNSIIELEAISPENEKVWLEIEFMPILSSDNKINGFLGITKDISVRKNYQNAKLETENKFKALAMASPDAIIITDLSLNIGFASNIAAKIFDYPEQSLPSSFTDLLDITEQNTFNSIIQDLTDNNSLQSEVFIGRKHNGAKMFIDVSIGLLSDSNNYNKELVLIVRDITERKKIELQLIEAKNKAEESNKTKGEFIANTSHEIRTPLNAIMGYADILKQQLKGNNAHLDMISGIQKGAAKLLSIINTILDLAKMESGHIRPAYAQFNLIQTIIEIKQLYTELAKKKQLKLKVKIADNFPVQIISDDIKIRQIITNLMDNAIKFTEKGEISLSVNFKDKGKSVDLLIAVKDTGIGIDLQKQNMIFQPFSQQEGQSSRKYSGTGLGLTLTKKIVEMLNGTVSLQSKINEGTEFIITIPNVRKAQLNGADMFIPVVDKHQFTVVIISSDLEFINNISTLLYQANIPCLAYSDLNISVLNTLEFKSIIIDYDSCKLIENRINSMAEYLRTDKSFVLSDKYKDLASSAFKNINNVEIVNKGNISYICGELLELSAKFICKNSDIVEFGSAELIQISITKLDIKVINKIIDELEQKWTSTKKLIDTEEINQFAEQVVALAQDIESEELELYGKLLARQIANFDLDILKESFDAFENIINQKISEKN